MRALLGAYRNVQRLEGKDGPAVQLAQQGQHISISDNCLYILVEFSCVLNAPYSFGLVNNRIVDGNIKAESKTALDPLNEVLNVGIEEVQGSVAASIQVPCDNPLRFGQVRLCVQSKHWGFYARHTGKVIFAHRYSTLPRLRLHDSQIFINAYGFCDVFVHGRNAFMQHDCSGAILANHLEAV